MSNCSELKLISKKKMNVFKRRKILVTHSGTFHTDDIFSTAILSILNNGNIKIIRIKPGMEIPTNFDYVYDIGGIYNPDNNQFDHHQKDGPLRENGIPYSSVGLIWKKYGEQICGNKKVAERIEKRIIVPIDALDNGVDICRNVFGDIFCYDVGDIFKSEIPTWKEDPNDMNKAFFSEVKKAIILLEREIKVAQDDIEGVEMIVDYYKHSVDKKIIILEKNFPRYLYQEVLGSLPEPIYIVLPDTRGKNWKTEAVRMNSGTKDSRKPFPLAWRGEIDLEKLREMTGIPDIIFCHRNGFLASTNSKETAILLAEKALIA